jgi:hypothetical protein
VGERIPTATGVWQRLGDERQEANMDAEVFVTVITLAVIALITAGLFERRDASGADRI